MAHVPIKRKATEHDIHKFQGKESFLTSQIELYVEEAKPKIPDGGWGWMVVFAAFVLNTISEGVSFSFGLLYVEFLEEFKASKSATAWIGSLFLAIPLLAGPIGSALVDRYGCIKMTVLGGVVCTIGFVLSMFANSINLMYLTFGLIGGIGRGFTFVTAVVPIAFWFERHRTIALGLAASGSGFGTIIFAPFTSYILSEYGWRGSMLILGGCFFNMCVCGFLMRDPDWIIEEEKEKKAQEVLENKMVVTIQDGGIDLEELKKLLEKKTNVNEKPVTQTNTLSAETNNSTYNRVKSAVDLPTFLKANEKVPVEVIKQLSQNEPLYKMVRDNYPHLVTTKSTETENLSHKNETAKPAVKPQRKITITKTEDTIPEIDENEENAEVPLTHETHIVMDAGMCTGKNKGHSHSYLNLLRTRKHSFSRQNTMLSIHKFKVSAASCPNMYGGPMALAKKEDVQEEIEEKWYVEFFKGLKSLLNFSLFLELHFFLLSISTIILFIWFIVPYFYLAEHMSRLGYSDSQASFVLSGIGLTNTLGMVFLGWAGDRVNIAKTYAICLMFCGISVAGIMFLAFNYILLCISSAGFGLFFASCFSLLPSLLAELVPLEDFTMAYGLVLLCQGIGNLTGPPLAGMIFDMTGSWDQSFYQAAFWIFICGILIGIIPYTRNRRMFGTGPMLNEKDFHV